MKIADIKAGVWYATKKGPRKPRLVIPRRTAIFTRKLRTESGDTNEQLIAFTPDAALGDMRRGYGRVGYLTIVPSSGDFTEWTQDTDTPPELATIAGHLDALLQQIPVGIKDAVPVASIRAWAKDRGFVVGALYSRDIDRTWTEYAADEQVGIAARKAVEERRRALDRERNQAWTEILELCASLGIDKPPRRGLNDQLSMEPADFLGMLS